MKRLTLKLVAHAYQVMKERGWSPTAGLYCKKEDRKVCPLAAVAFHTLKRLPNMDNYDVEIAVSRRYGVSEAYCRGVINGVDDPKSNPNQHFRVRHSNLFPGQKPEEFLAGFALGKKCYARFIAK